MWQDVRDPCANEKLIIRKALYLIFIVGRGRSFITVNQIKEIRLF